MGKTVNKLKKVLILTLPLENNYGGLMQAYALQRAISEMGYDVTTDKNACKKRSWKYRIYSKFMPIKNILLSILGKEVLTEKLKKERDKNLIRFIKENINTTDFFRGRLIPSQEQIEKYDVFVVGSDQVWRKEYVWVQSYMLSFLKDRKDKRRIAFSASFGLDDIDEWSEADVNVGEKLFPLFNAISVREVSGQNILSKEFGVMSTLVLDPTMLLSKGEYQNLDAKGVYPRKGKFLFCYILDMDDDKKKLIDYIKKEVGAENIEYVLPKQKRSPKDNNFILPSVGEWLSGFRDAEFVVTDSFHGTVFSIIFNKPFVCYANKSRGISRMQSLLSLFDLKERMILNSEAYTKLENIDYPRVNNILEKKREEALEFLRKSLS